MQYPNTLNGYNLANSKVLPVYKLTLTMTNLQVDTSNN